MASVRLFGHFHPEEQPGRVVDEIKLRILTTDLPDDTEVHVTDVQLQPGRHTTGWNLHPRDLGVQPVAGWEFRNGTVYGDMTVIVVADTPSASPTRWDVSRADGNVRIGGYHFGHVDGSATVDGHARTATQGAGIPPHLTKRADVDLDVSVEGRARLTAWFRGIATDIDNEPPPIDEDDLPINEDEEEQP